MDSFDELIGKLSERPAMYIGRKSISSLSAFLDGWCMGKNFDTDELSGFREWLMQKYRLNDSHASWDRIILFYSQDESDALDNFFQLYKEYKQTEANPGFRTTG